METIDITLYGAPWCPYCQRTKKFLQEQRVPFAWVDIEQTAGASERIAELNGGTRSIPTLVYGDGSFQVAPTTEQLAERLGITREAIADVYDLAIVGGGPTGLTTAIYAARENASVLVIDRGGLGGQAGVTERFDNYPGFPDGVGGAELADRIIEQARRYGVELLPAVGVEEIAPDGDRLLVRTSTGQEVRAASVLVATGSSYRRTGADGEAELIGAGIHFCATCDGPFYRGRDEVVVVGGGNSGLEEGLFLTQFAKRVTIVEYSDRLAGSKLLQERVRTHPQMRVFTSTAVKRFEGDERGGSLRRVIVEDRTTGTERAIEAAGAFVFIGLDPNAAFLTGVIDLDERGFVVTDRSFMTSMPGVFAAGDVRAGSTKQLAAAVGEGAAAAIQIRYYLDARSATAGVTSASSEAALARV